MPVDPVAAASSLPGLAVAVHWLPCCSMFSTQMKSAKFEVAGTIEESYGGIQVCVWNDLIEG